MPAQSNIISDLKNLRNSQYFLTLLMLLFVAVMAWVGVSVFSSQQSTKISSKLIQHSKPLNPAIDSETLNKLELKREFTESELQSFTIFTLYTSRDGSAPVPVPLGTTPDQPTPTASPSGSVATVSATLAPATPVPTLNPDAPQATDSSTVIQ